CGRQTTSTLSGSFFFFYSSPRFKLFFTPGLAGGCLWYHQQKKWPVAALLQQAIFMLNRLTRPS
ncbi:hypothetical protein, partial [Flavonifractor sp. An52]|uniref:hypothetical protein n=1 Tax=Flavonifractor sp. An52 TaxID=1965642 RepID=UPI00194E6FEE